MAKQGASLPDKLTSGIQNISGVDVSDVRVHYNSAKPAELGAHAYSQGNEIHLGPGQERHLPHEAWHVVQQRQGRVAPASARVATNVGLTADEQAAKTERELLAKRTPL